MLENSLSNIYNNDERLFCKKIVYYNGLKLKKLEKKSTCINQPDSRASNI